jgi:REP element-mobilizing transposase RayT
MRTAVKLLMVCALILLPGISVAADRFDGNWSTKLTCPAKGNTEGYTWQFYLRQPAIADMVVEAIQYNAANLGHYVLHAFVVMPNHVHLLATPALALPKLTKSLKGITSKRANTILAMTGNCFWQEESYDHLVRNERELEKIRCYIEENPVRAGLVREANEYRWSSAGWVTRGSPADQGVRPTAIRRL